MVLDLPELETIYLYITQKCNMACPHCWVRASPKAGSEITIDRLKDAIYEAKELGLRRLKITGGEPYTRKKLLHTLLEIASALRLTIYLETNGVLINENEAEFLKGRNVGVSISLDFPDERHDAFRRLNSSFKRIIRAMEMLSKHMVRWTCIMTVTKSNIKDIDTLAKLVISLGAYRVKIHPCVALGQAWSLEEELLSPIDCLKLARLVSQLDPMYDGKIFTSMPLAVVAPFFRWPRLRSIAGVCSYKNLLSILPNGDVALCGIGITHPETVLGNISRSNISEIWQEAYGYLKELRSLTPASFAGICSKCLFNKFCANRCPAYVYETFGTFSASHPVCEALYQAGLFPPEYLTNTQDRKTAESKLGVWEAARYLDFPVDVVYEMLERGELPGKKIKGRWRIDLEKLDRWLDEEVPQEELEKLSERLEIDQKQTQESFEQPSDQRFCNL